MHPSLDNLVLQFRDEALACTEKELKRTWPRYDPSKNYCEEDFSDLLFSCGKGTETIQFCNEKLADILSRLPNRQAPKQYEINLAFREFQEAVSKFKGGTPKYTDKDISSLIQQTRNTVFELYKFTAFPHRIFKDQYGTKTFDNADDVSLSLRIDDSYLKINMFVACNSTIFLQLLRAVCDPSISFLARIITARSNFEVALHTLQLVERLDSAANRAERKLAQGALAELEPFVNQYLRSIDGTRSPLNDTDEQIPAYNVLDCFNALGKKGSDDRDDAEKFYGHLCDFAHPNAGMRNLLTKRELVPGDYFSWQYKLDYSHLGNSRLDQNIALLLEATERSSEYMSQALVKIAAIKSKLTSVAKKEGNKRGDGEFITRERDRPESIDVNDYPSVVLNREFIAKFGHEIIPSFYEYLIKESKESNPAIPNIASEAINSYKTSRPELFEGLDERGSFIKLIQAFKEERKYACSD